MTLHQTNPPLGANVGGGCSKHHSRAACTNTPAASFSSQLVEAGEGRGVSAASKKAQASRPHYQEIADVLSAQKMERQSMSRRDEYLAEQEAKYPMLTRDQTNRRNMLQEAIQAAPPAYLAMWLKDALAVSDMPNEMLDDLSNQIGRIPHERARCQT